ncbi:thiamine diphosphokinase [Rhodophyticola sp. CCM32]|uniref:thiamine diphosphokinase n=1 Tax=Rhodophyticola sp. CCM32 TaxID=2916397 RepID=UPI001EE5DBF4|nr:thiamine diphosphokinase [Rhodophyticola sp. CCM32]
MVTLLGGGEHDPADLADALARAPVLVAADGGADHALALGHHPDAVIGDMDSLSRDARAVLGPQRLHRIAEQSTTDFDKALRNISAPGVIAVGVTGRRIDHELAVYHTLITRPEKTCVVLGREDIVFHAPPRLRLDLPVGMRVSLFPMAAVRGQSTGLRWPIEPIDFRPLGQIGTSNETAAPQVEMRFDGPGMLVILPRAALDAVLSALI